MIRLEFEVEERERVGAEKIIISDRLSLSRIDVRCTRKKEKSFNLTMLIERKKCSRRRERECLFLFIFDFSLSLSLSRSLIDRKKEKDKGLTMLFIYRTRFFSTNREREKKCPSLLICFSSSSHSMQQILGVSYDNSFALPLSLSPCFFLFIVVLLE